jgi:hypothetical protein
VEVRLMDEGVSDFLGLLGKLLVVQCLALSTHVGDVQGKRKVLNACQIET